MFRLTSCVVALVLLVDVFPTLTQAVIIETVPVGNPGNDDWHGDGFGDVGYVYNIGKYEVTAGQYTEFLNAVAADDTYGLYSGSMWSSTKGCKIQQGGSSGSYTYSVATDWANRPVSDVSWGDAARFANWMHNGQPTGAQGNSTTEDGSYNLNGAVSDSALMAITRERDSTWVIPTEYEWFTAAYHKNYGVTGNYFDYPTSSDSIPGYIGNGESIPDPDPGNYATYDGDYGTDGIGSPYYNTEVGEHENSASPYGTFDQGGNVGEWNETDWAGDGRRGLRGESSGSGEAGLRASYNSLATPTYELFHTGFRVASLGVTWDNGSGDSNWATAANWYLDYVPDVNFVTIIANGDAVLLDSPNQEARSVLLESGTLHVAAGGELSVTEGMIVAADSTLTGSGIVTTSTPITVEWGGAISPGDDVGTLLVSSIVLQSGSTLSVELSGPGLGDRLDLAGELNLAARGEGIRGCLSDC